MSFGFITVNSNKKNWSQNILHFGIATWKVLQERSNETASFAEYMKIKKKKMVLTYMLSEVGN